MGKKIYAKNKVYDKNLAYFDALPVERRDAIALDMARTFIMFLDQSASEENFYVNMGCTRLKDNFTLSLARGANEKYPVYDNNIPNLFKKSREMLEEMNKPDDEEEEEEEVEEDEVPF